MVTFPNCKINLGLHILRKRSDGYHDIETCMYPVAWQDVLEIIPSTDQTKLEITGSENLSAGPDNLCLKAYQLFREKYEIPPVHMHLHKVLPFGAGLGGGSSDGAFTLSALNKLFNLNISAELLEQYAAQLGSDCPFFIRNTPIVAGGRGEILQNVDLSLQGTCIVVVYPGVGVSTAEAYNSAIPNPERIPLQELIKMPVEEWRANLHNDFEEGVFKKLPQLKEIKNELYTAGAFYASMSGSGSSVFGLFNSEPTAFTFPHSRMFKGILS